jgi:hypothetical protein
MIIHKWEPDIYYILDCHRPFICSVQHLLLLATSENKIILKKWPSGTDDYPRNIFALQKGKMLLTTVLSVTCHLTYNMFRECRVQTGNAC